MGQRDAAGGCAGNGVTDDDGVVAAWEDRGQAAFYERNHVFQNRCTRYSKVMGDAGEAIAAGPREVSGKIALVLAEDVDAERLAFGEGGQRLGSVIHADKELRWIERERRHGAHGHAAEFAVGGSGSDNGHAGEPVARNLFE